MTADDRELDLAAALGAEREASTQVLSLYITNKDRRVRRINTRPWWRKGQRVSAQLAAREVARRLGLGVVRVAPRTRATPEHAPLQPEPPPRRELVARELPHHAGF